MPKNFRILRDKMPARLRAEAEAETERLIREMPLDELREARRLTQQQLAEQLGIGQAAVSRLERRTDMYVSTLQRMVEAMGGELQIRAVFPDGAVAIKRFAND